MTAKPRRKTSQAPKGRNNSAQGNALGNASPEAQSPEGATQSGELPKGWRWVTLGDVAESMKNGIYKPASSYADDGMACLRMYNIGDGKIVWRDIKRMRLSEVEVKEYELLHGDLLVNRVNSRELVGKSVAIPTGLERCVFESKNIRVRIRRDLVLPEFVSYRLLSAGSRYFTQNAQQVVGMASISQPQVARFPLPLPPLDDQRRIVAEIEKQFTRLEAGVAALRRVQANLKRYRAAVLKAACEGRLVPTEAGLARAEGRPFESGQQLLARILTERRQNWLAQRSLGKGGQGRGKYKEPDSADAEGLPTLPEGWAWATMPQLGDLGRGKSKHRPRDDSRLYGGPYPFIQTGDVRKSGGTIRQHSQTYSEFGLNQSKLWPVGTLCITIAANIAETGILTFDACFPDSVVGFVHRNTVTTRFVEFFIRTAKEKLEQFAPATAQKNINLDVLQNVAIPLPPLAEQTRIVAEVERRLSVVEELEAVVTTNLQRATRLRQSILQKAFAGEMIAADRAG